MAQLGHHEGERAFVRPVAVDRPKSAVSTGVGLVGLTGLLLWIAVARQLGLSGSWSSLLALLASGIPMILWSIIVDKVHLRPTTGMNWTAPLAIHAMRDVSFVKLVGLWVTWCLIGCFYALFRWYWRDNYLFSMELFQAAAPILVGLSVPYILWIDRYLIEPRDGAWHFGAWLTGQAGCERDKIIEHFRSWAVKGVFLCFMFSILPGSYTAVVAKPMTEIMASPVTLALWLINLMFVIDIVIATLGYLLTLRLLDAHIRSANPHMQGWFAALLCYPPLVIIGEGRILEYRVGTWGEENWIHWLSGSPVIQACWGAALVGLIGVYAWATFAFGLRFSNLTHRGIVTHGPYAFSKHPAYLAKNLYWWLASLPFLVANQNPVDAVRNCAALALIGGLYYWRAITEERHLSEDPDYRTYACWMDAHAPVTRFFRWVTGRTLDPRDRP